MFEKILVPLDGSSVAESVLPYAKGLALKFDAEITLLGVYEPGATYTENLYGSYLKTVSSIIKNDLGDLGLKDPKIKIEVVAGKPAAEILTYADKENIALIILARYGSSGESPGTIGSVALRVLRIASKPVLIIRHPADDTVKHNILITKILVPLDDSKVGEAALPYAEALAQKFEAELVLLNIVEPAPSSRSDRSSAVYRARNKEDERIALDYINNMTKSIKAKGLITSGMVLAGYPADAIIKYSEEHAIDLIAISTHGRSGDSRWAIGSVTDKILYHGTIPVIVEHAIIQTDEAK